MAKANELDRRVGRNIRTYRLVRRLYQDELAAKMQALGYGQWTQQTIHMIEKGQRRVSVSEIYHLSQILDTTIDALLAEEIL